LLQRSVAFIEDVALKTDYNSASELANDLEVRYDQSALNCWVAAIIYLATLCISAQQYYMNVRTCEVPSVPFQNFASIN
jgi:ribonuclease kappa